MNPALGGEAASGSRSEEPEATTASRKLQRLPARVASRCRALSLRRVLLWSLALAPILGCIGVIAAEAVPDRFIYRNLYHALWFDDLSRESYSPTAVGTTADHSSECVALGVGLGDRPGRNHFQTALESPSYGKCEFLAERLEITHQTGKLPPGSPYLRYWHGYTLITRPAVAVFGLVGTRWISLCLLLVSWLVFAAGTARRFGRVAGIALVAPLLATTDAIVGGDSISQSIGMSTAWLGATLCFAVTRRMHRDLVAVAAVAALGAAINAYFDLMTTIPGSFSLCVLGACLGLLSERRTVDSRLVMIGAAAGVGWIIGLGWMWGSKWLVSIPVLGWDEVLDNVKRQVEFRLSGMHEGVVPSRVVGFSENWFMWWNQALTPWLVAVSALVVFVAIWRCRRQTGELGYAALAAAAVGVPVAVCFMVLNNHSQIHPWLVYRNIPIAWGAVCCLLLSVSDVLRFQDSEFGTNDRIRRGSESGGEAACWGDARANPARG